MKTFPPRAAFLLIIVFYRVIAFSQVDVLTQHNDLSRTGWNKQETILNHTNVRSGSFGKVFTLSLDDQVYAQPLVVSGVVIPSFGPKNVVYVCTENNSVYAFDADNGTPYWQVNFIPTGFRIPTTGDMHPGLCGGGYFDFGFHIGIVGTPVIDKAANTMYFVTKIVSNTGIDNHTYVSGLTPDDEYNYSTTGFHQYLHAIDLRTGTEKANSPVEITASYPGTGDGSALGVISFDPRRQFNRSGLVLSRGIVYIAFAAHCDWDPSHGWLLGYDASTLAQKIVYNTTPNDGRGGIWMSGAAPAVDGSGSLYFTSGNSNNGGIDPPGNVYPDLPSVIGNRGESVLKVTPNQPDNTATSVSVSSYFTPLDYVFKNEADLDFSIQVLLLPNTHTLLTGCKDDSLYLMDTTSLGGYSSTSNGVLQTVFLNPPSAGGDLHTSLAYFGGSNVQYVYQMGENTQLQAFPVGANSLGAAIVNSQPNIWPTGSMGGFLSVSSNGSDTSTGILWVTHAVNGCNFAPCQGIFRAIKANDINTELWNSKMNGSDDLGSFGKMSCPTIANGKVYQSNNASQVIVYGLLSPLPLDLVSFTANNVNDEYVQLKWSTSGETTFDHFDVERSADGVVFTKLAAVKGESGTSGVQYYSAVDDNPLNGINYYRLKEVSLNGNIFYSQIITVNISKDPAPRISPNPANTYFTVLAGAEPIEEINLLDASGKKIEHVVNGYSSTSVTVATGSLATGIYIVEIKTASHAYHQKLFKQ
jgi:outer membrane protein assembly factor BamB